MAISCAMGIDRAVASAQKALSEDPENATARQILDKAEKGRQARARVQAGDPAAERALYDAHVDRVYRLAYRMTGDEALAHFVATELPVGVGGILMGAIPNS